MNEHELDTSVDALNEAEGTPSAEEVETDALTNALDSLAKAMNKDSYAKADMEEEDMEKGKMSEDMDSDEMKAKDMESKDMESKDADSDGMESDDEDFIDLEEAMKAMADHTDRLVADMGEKLDAILQSVEAMLVEMKNMKAEQGNMNKSLNAVVDAPVPPRAVTSVPASVAPMPTALNRGDLITKALTKLQDPQTDSATRYRLRTTIAQLEAGAPLTQFSDLG